MTVAELQIEMEIQALRERVSKLEEIVRDLTAAPQFPAIDLSEE
jgi:hypothetical protein